MAEVFYWSDTHFGDELVSYNRDFDTTDDQDEFLIKAWESKVSKKDTVWLLGDLCDGKPNKALEIIGDLPGRKHLVAGNHDICHPMHKNSHNKQAKYLEVFESVSTMGRQKIGHGWALLSHFPYDTDSKGDDPTKYDQYRLRDMDHLLIHGHVHGEWLIRESQINVGVERWMGGPASVDEILEAFFAYENGYDQ